MGTDGGGDVGGGSDGNADVFCTDAATDFAQRCWRLASRSARSERSHAADLMPAGAWAVAEATAAVAV